MAHTRVRKCDCKLTTVIKQIPYASGQRYKVVRTLDFYYVHGHGPKKHEAGVWLQEKDFNCYFDIVDLKIYNREHKEK